MSPQRDRASGQGEFNVADKVEETQMRMKKGAGPAEKANGNAMSRRAWLGGAAMIGVGAACVMSVSAQAQSKQKPETVKYQDSPKGEAKCENCSLFQPPDACGVVEGKVSPNGWCQVYAKKG